MLERDDKCDCDCIAHIVFLFGLIAFAVYMLTAQPADEQCIDKQLIEYADEQCIDEQLIEYADEHEGD